MKLEFTPAKKEDAELLVQISHASVYDDFIRFGVCPGYGKTVGKCGNPSCNIPGTSFYVITPAEKEENIRFYTQKCGFETDSSLMDGNVEEVRFISENHFFGKEWDPNETSADR